MIGFGDGMRKQPTFKRSHLLASYTQRKQNNLNKFAACLCEFVSDKKHNLMHGAGFSKVAVRMMYESVTQRW